ncbi:MAG: hypothetical protein OIN89_07875 [Candidatus Methanoperedens sp.]|nr:hypothetical protein [Candidatus Methanoperedens sp.]PKL53492.1 MAG: hypothetical protein CVV36_06915 [Candidatus Methanoperedenaceae archaeon HGW-Methanoperedenaceae-1]
MIQTGICKMDELLHGGIPKGKSLIYYAQPGVDYGIFGLHTIFNTLKKGGKGVFIVNSTTPNNIRDTFREFGWHIDFLNNDFVFVDAFSSLIRSHSDEKFVISNPDNIEELDKKLLDLLRNSPACTVVFESLSTIMDLYGEKETIKSVKGWNEIAKVNGHVMIYNFTAWAYPRETLDLIKTELFNAVVTICGSGEYVIFSKYLGISKLDWKKEPEKLPQYESGYIMNKGIVTPWLEYEINGSLVNIMRENHAFECPSLL